MAYKSRFKPKNKSKYMGNPSSIICRSLWERRMCKYLDSNINKNGKIETTIIEVKPKKQTQKPQKKNKKSRTFINECIRYSINEAKWKAAEEACNKNGWRFIILTEEHLLN